MKNFLLAASFLLCGALSSQTLNHTFRLSEGPPENDESAMEFVCELPSGYLFKRTTGILKLDYEFLEYNSKMEFVRIVKVKQETYKKNKARLYTVIKLGVNYYMFFATADRKSNQMDLVYTQMDIKTLTSTGTVKFITSVSINLSYEGEALRLLTNDNFAPLTFQRIREDSSLLIVSIDHPNTIKSGLDSMPIQILRFDSKMSELSNWVIPFKPSSNLFGIKQILSGVDNSVALLGVEFINETNAMGERSDSGKYVFHCFTAFPRSKSCTSIGTQLKISNGQITDLTLVKLNKQKLSLFGYSTSEEGNYADGVFFQTLDPTSLVQTHLNQKPFPADYVFNDFDWSAQRRINSATKSSRKINWEMIFQNPVLLADGSIIIVSEQFKKYFDGYGVVGNTTYPIYYDIYNDIHLIKVSPQGEIEWMKKISKCHRVNSIAPFGSFLYVQQKDNVSFFFNESNDTEINSESVNPIINNHVKTSYVRQVIVDASGSFTYGRLFAPSRSEAMDTKVAGHLDTGAKIFWIRSDSKKNLVRLD